MKSSISYFIVILFLSFFGCNKDPCSMVTCEKGYCDNGECICLPGYEGPECDQPITPELIHIHRILVTDWPETNNGTSWDSLSIGDIYPSLSIDNDIIWKSDVFYPDASKAYNYYFDTEPTLTIEPGTQCTISLWDADTDTTSGNAELMGEVEFILQANPGFPSFFKVHGVDLSFELFVSYKF